MHPPDWHSAGVERQQVIQLVIYYEEETSPRYHSCLNTFDRR